jgi:hypothetical protein
MTDIMVYGAVMSQRQMIPVRAEKQSSPLSANRRVERGLGTKSVASGMQLGVSLRMIGCGKASRTLAENSHSIPVILTLTERLHRQCERVARE